jgi:hypothetical protein
MDTEKVPYQLKSLLFGPKKQTCQMKRYLFSVSKKLVPGPNKWSTVLSRSVALTGLLMFDFSADILSILYTLSSGHTTQKKVETMTIIHTWVNFLMNNGIYCSALIRVNEKVHILFYCVRRNRENY